MGRLAEALGPVLASQKLGCPGGMPVTLMQTLRVRKPRYLTLEKNIIDRSVITIPKI